MGLTKSTTVAKQLPIDACAKGMSGQVAHCPSALVQLSGAGRGPAHEGGWRETGGAKKVVLDWVSWPRPTKNSVERRHRHDASFAVSQ